MFDTSEILTLEERHWPTDPKSLKTKHQCQMGKAIECYVKEGLQDNTAQYLPYDGTPELGGVRKLLEIKSRRLHAGTFSISSNEYLRGKQEVAEGRDIVYILYVQLNETQFQFDGVAMFSDLLNITTESVYYDGWFFNAVAARKYFIK